jgi:multiple sugar transport system substrate-binding protein
MLLSGATTKNLKRGAFVMFKAKGIKLVILCVVVCLFMGVVFVSSGATAEQVELVWQEWMSSEIPTDLFQGWLKDFEAQNPGVKIRTETVPYTGMRDKALATFFAGNLADVLQIPPSWFFEFAKMGAFEPLESLIEKEKAGFLDVFPSAQLKYKYNDKLYYLPFNNGGIVLFYNKKILDEAGVKVPTTWEEFHQACKTTTNPEKNIYGTSLPFSTTAVESDKFFMPLIIQAGGSVIEDHTAAINSPAGVKTLQFIADLVKSGVVTPSYLVDGMVEARDQFALSQATFFMDGNWLIHILDKKGSNTPYETAILPKDVTTGTLTGFWMFVISSQSKHKEIAWEFIKFLTNEDNMRNFCLRTGWLPARNSLLKDPEIRQMPHIAPFLDQLMLPGAECPEFIPNYEQLRKELNLQMQEVLLGNKTAKQALDDAAIEWNKVLGEFYK